jgi:chemosensory pili system protein ChpA (sensor histidine kinase/response regulator)
MADVALQTFEFVGRELNTALGEARAALESYAEQPQNLSLLERCKQELHQVQGVLRVLEIYGAALLAEEMEHVTAYLLTTAAEQKNQAESLDALMRAMVQLPSYLERVLAGGRDLALVLLPLLNDLRAVRGSALLSEGTLLLLNLKSDKQPQPAAAAAPPGEAELAIEQWARRLRAKFQMGLIGWIRGERIVQNLDMLATVSSKLEQFATHQPVFQLWWVVGAVIEALQQNGLEEGVSVKRLLGLADREIKRLYQDGELRYAQTPALELLNNLLYYVGRATSSGPKVSAVRASFKLGELLPVDEAIEQERENLSAPSVKLMQTVAAAIREDLSKVKDVLDIFVRRGAGQPQELNSQVEMLRKIGDTLGVLGLGELRENVQAQTERLQKIVAKELAPDEAVLVDIAASLIAVEDRLDERLVGMILPRSAPDAPKISTDFQLVQGAVLRECISNLARVKETVSQNVGGLLDVAGLDSWQDLMRGIEAGLLMLGKTRAMQVLELITEQLRHVMRPGVAVLPGGFVDRLADAIVSVEYYMETVQSGRNDPWYMLENAETCIKALQNQVIPAVPTVGPGDAAAGAEPENYEKTQRIASPFAVDRVPTLAPVSPVGTTTEVVDPELVQLFIEEAREELAKITKLFATWEQNPLEQDALSLLRRSFHTLKGSGRMVNARELSEFAWASENLLNRLLDNTLTRSPAIVTVLRESVTAFVQLIDQLDKHTTPQADIAGIVARAHALAATRGLAPRVVPVAPVSAKSEAIEIPADPPVLLAATPASGTDEVLREIYARETRTHIGTVRNYVTRQQQRPAPHLLSEEVYRACHTLSGSSKMAEARHGIRLAEPLDHWLRKAFNNLVGLQSGDLQLLEECMGAMESVATHLDESTGYFSAHDALRLRIAQAERELDQRIDEELRHRALLAEQTAAVAVIESPASIDYDAEVAEIFVEEALELIEALQSALTQWREEPDSAERRGALKRPLHTLKGGARMAGIMAMGDLSHELETLVVHMDGQGQDADPRAFEVIQTGLDELARLREQVTARGAIRPAKALIQRIHGLLDPQAAAAAPVLPAIPEPAPAAAPLIEDDKDASAAEAAAAEAVIEIESFEFPVETPAAPQAVPPGRDPVTAVDRPEMARVDAELLDQMLNAAGEASIARARLEQQLGAIDFNLGELTRTVTRLKDQLRNLEIETEAQILHRHEKEAGAHRSDFDPLELDRYSSIQQFSRALAETANDVASIQQLLETLTQDTQNLLQQQARIITELQNGLMRTRMVPFQRHVQRLARIVRQAGTDSSKRAELIVQGAAGELDRQVLERMLPPFEHMLRNAVVHGIEPEDKRIAAGKPPIGRITLELHRDGAEVMVRLSDDGAGMNLRAIRDKAIAIGLIRADQNLSDEDVTQLILEPGFSTAGAVTQQAGRGVGMDVVATEVKRLGGALHMETKSGAGTQFTVRLPFTLAISHALVVRTGEEFYALPLPTVEGVLRLSKTEVAQHLNRDTATFEYNSQKYRFQFLAAFVGLESAPLPEQDVTIPVVLVRAGEHSTGLVADELIGSREIVVKSVGPHVSSIRGISGATILGDGKIVVILDIGALVRAEWRGRNQPTLSRDKSDKRTVALVVDDSITVRRVTQRLLERNGMRVLTARDGLDALALLQETVPDIILLDIEMPRMDGYEVAAYVRNDARLREVPIIMITSRAGEKHRARAIELGVDDYLGKPYQEMQLLDAITPLIERRHIPPDSK